MSAGGSSAWKFLSLRVKLKRSQDSAGEEGSREVGSVVDSSNTEWAGRQGSVFTRMKYFSAA